MRQARAAGVGGRHIDFERRRETVGCFEQEAAPDQLMVGPRARVMRSTLPGLRAKA